MSPWRRRFANQRGFTLAELLVITAVAGLLMAGIFALQQQGQEAYLFGSNRVETQQNARVALSLMTRELRAAASTPAAPTGITAIASGPSITFLNQDGQTITYALSGTTINRTVAGTTTALIGGVQTLTVTCYSDGGATATTNPTLVKTIRIRIVTTTEEGAAPGSAGDARSTMESTVKLRATLS
jgi:Tfp pilus assembly protein PilW